MPKSESNEFNNELQAFLKSNKASDHYTHTSIGRPQGSYNIKSMDEKNFMDLYYNVVFEKKIPTYLTEGFKDMEYTPLRIDLDFRYYSNDCQRLYTINDIKNICMKYMYIINEYLEDLEDDERTFYILEKPSATIDKDKNGINKKNEKGLYKIKDGIHIFAPGIVTNEYLQLIFRDYVYKNCGDILDKYNFDNSYADVFDKAVIDRANWQMYGSTKPNQPPYQVTHMWKVYSDRIEEIVNVPSDRELIHLLSVRNKFEHSMYRLDKQDEIEKLENDKKHKKNNISKKKKKNIVNKCSKQDLEQIIKFVGCLHIERARNYKTWLDVGFCLNNLHNKDDTLLQSWIKFSKLPSEYKDTAEESCKEKWDEMNGNETLRIPSLKMWAKEDAERKKNEKIQKYHEDVKNSDNQELLLAHFTKLKDEETEYQIATKDETWKHIMKACNNSKGSSWDVAGILKAMFKDFYICVSIEKSKWYYYNETLHRWIMDDKGIMLKSKISTDLYREFLRKKNDLSNKASLHPDPSECKEQDDAQKINKVMLRLKETAYKSNLMTECCEIFYDKERKFVDQLDSYNHLLGFNNGVYDLKQDEFRKGRPEDFISKSTNIDYIPYDPLNEEIKEIYRFYESIFVIKNVRDYVLTRSASFLSGSTKDESFDIYSGKGGNGKSKHMELMEQAFGDYAVKLPIQLLTAKRAASNAATPELARTKGARLCSMQEPDTATKINVGLMKELTGGDKIQARALYGDPIEFKPQFKIVLSCNDKPELPPNDDGTWRRVRNTEFISKFTYPENIFPEKVLDFKIDPELSEKFENWAEPFMSILINYHKKWKKESLRPPSEINEYTQEYRDKNTAFVDFFESRVDGPLNDEFGVTISEIYSAYKSWFGDNLGDSKPRGRKELIAYLDDRYGKPKGDGIYRGLRIKEEPTSCQIRDDRSEAGDELDN